MIWIITTSKELVWTSLIRMSSETKETWTVLCVKRFFSSLTEVLLSSTSEISPQQTLALGSLVQDLEVEAGEDSTCVKGLLVLYLQNQKPRFSDYIRVVFQSHFL